MYLKINYNYNFTAFIYRQFFGQTPENHWFPRLSVKIRRVIYSTKYAFFFYSKLFSFSPYTSKKLPRIINTIISTRLTIKYFLIQLIDISPCLFFFSLILLQNPQRSLQIPNIPDHIFHIISSSYQFQMGNPCRLQLWQRTHTVPCRKERKKIQNLQVP